MRSRTMVSISAAALLALATSALTACDGTEADLFAPITDDGPDIQLGPIAAEHLWSRGHGSAGYDRARGVALDPAGDVLLGGHFGEAIDLGGGTLPTPADPDHFGAFLVKHDGADGAHLWSRAMVGTGTAEIAGVTADAAGAAIVVGTMHGSIDFGDGPVAVDHAAFAARYSPEGELIWVKTFDSTGTAAGAAIDVAEDHLYVAVWFRGTLTVGTQALVSAGGADAALIAMDLDGQTRWTRHLAGPGEDTAGGVAATPDGAAIVGRASAGMAVEGGGELGATGAFVARYGVAGDLLWADLLAGDREYGTGVAFHPGGAVTVCGSSAPNSFLAHYSADGQRLWWRASEVETYSTVTALTTDGEGRIWMAGMGHTMSEGEFHHGAFLTAHDASGATRAVRLYPSDAMIWDLVATDGEIVVSGAYHDLDLGGGALPPIDEYNHDTNAFVARLRPLAAGAAD